MASIRPPATFLEPVEQAGGLALLDVPLHNIGLKIMTVSSSLVSACLNVTHLCTSQLSMELHGGISAMIAEGLAGMGALKVSTSHRVAGVHLTINHYTSACLGDLLLAEATPEHVGRTTQVWEVKMWKIDASTTERIAQISSAKVILVITSPEAKRAKDAKLSLRKCISKL